MTANEALKQVNAGYSNWWVAVVDEEDELGIGFVCVRYQGLCPTTGRNTWVDHYGSDYDSEQLGAFRPLGWLPTSTLPHRAGGILIIREEAGRRMESVESWNCVYQLWMLCSGVGRSENTIRGWKPLRVGVA